MNQERDGKADGDKQLSRRDILGKAGTAAFIGAGALCLGGLVRMVLPKVTPDASEQFKIGPPEDYPVGIVKNFDDQNVFVQRDAAGIFAISTVCTHLGCIVNVTETDDFECPCHGSRFAADGKVTQGPAPTPLAWLAVVMLPSGQLAVDKSQTVAAGTKMSLGS